MNVSFVNPVNTQQAGAVQGLQGQGKGTANPFQLDGGMPFDILMQQLMGMADTTGQQMVSFGSSTPDETPLFAMQQMPIFQQLKLNEDGTVDADQLAALLDQLNLPQDTESSLPAIFQEMQTALQQATDLGQNSVDLTNIFSSLNQTNAQKLVDFVATTDSQPAQALLSGMQQYLSTLDKSDGLTEQQKAAFDVIEKYVQPAVPQQQGNAVPVQETIPTAQDGQQKTQEMPQLDTESATDRTMRSSAAPETPVQLMAQNTADTADPQYLVPEYLSEPGMTFQVENMYQKPLTNQGLPQENVKGSLKQEMDALQSSLTGMAVSDDDSGTMQMRSSLNLTTDGQHAEEQLPSTDVTGAETEKLAVAFDEKLQKLQDTEAIVKQISKQMSMHQGVRTTELTVKLEPDHLGTVQVSVRSNGDQGVTAEMVVSHPQVKELLESDISALKNSLDDAQIKIHRFDISVADNFNENAIDVADHEQAAPQEQEERAMSSSSGEAFSAGDTTEADAPARTLMDTLHNVNILA